MKPRIKFMRVDPYSSWICRVAEEGAHRTGYGSTARDAYVHWLSRRGVA